MKHWNRHLLALSALASAALLGYAYEAHAQPAPFWICNPTITNGTQYNGGCFASILDPFNDPITYSGIKGGGANVQCKVEAYWSSIQAPAPCNAAPPFSDTQTHYYVCSAFGFNRAVVGIRACSAPL